MKLASKLGKTPFAAPNPWAIYKNVNKGIEVLKWHERIADEPEYIQFFTSLLQSTPSERLPMQQNGIDELKAHALYSGFDWSTINTPEKFTAPFKPPAPDVAKMLKRVRPMDIQALQVKYKDDGSDWDRDF